MGKERFTSVATDCIVKAKSADKALFVDMLENTWYKPFSSRSFSSMNTSPGSYLAIQITGMLGCYIAEVIVQDPLVLKVEEEGPFSRLKSGDYIIMESETKRLQDPKQETAVLREAIGRANAYKSGLRSLGVTDGQLHEIGPG